MLLWRRFIIFYCCILFLPSFVHSQQQQQQPRQKISHERASLWFVSSQRLGEYQPIHSTVDEIITDMNYYFWFDQIIWFVLTIVCMFVLLGVLIIVISPVHSKMTLWWMWLMMTNFIWLWWWIIGWIFVAFIAVIKVAWNLASTIVGYMVHKRERAEDVAWRNNVHVMPVCIVPPDGKIYQSAPLVTAPSHSSSFSSSVASSPTTTSWMHMALTWGKQKCLQYVRHVKMIWQEEKVVLSSSTLAQ